MQEHPNHPGPEATNFEEAPGNYSFTTIKYTLADLDKDGGKYIPTEKVYTVSEVSGEDENVEYDDKVYTITCILTDKGDNTIEVTTDEVPGAYRRSTRSL